MSETVVIIAFYKFVPLPDYLALREKLLRFCKEKGLKGTILLAEEGINSTISGARESIDALLELLRSDDRFSDLEWKESFAENQPFGKMKVRLKKEIVRMAVDDLDMEYYRGTYVLPDKWDALLEDEEVVLVDTRNVYEMKIGKFRQAIEPDIDNFREFPDWAQKHLDPKKHKKIAMYCTGGIRCEKTTALLKQRGFEKVYHLKGGILQYLEDTGNKSGNWEGECFVFDDRVAVDNTLSPSGVVICRYCSEPLTTDDLKWLEEEDMVCGRCANDRAESTAN